MLKNEDFCHLHLHCEYSTLDGFGSPKDFVLEAKRKRFRYLACTDHGNIDGLIKFQTQCEEHKIKHVLGAELYIVPSLEEIKTKRGHILILIKDIVGWRNICRLLSFANLKGFYYKPIITFDQLLKHHKGLIVSTACLQSFVNIDKQNKFLSNLNDCLGEDLYFEVMPNKLKRQITFNRNIIALAKYYGRQIIATNDCHYPKKEDWKAQEVLLAIQRKAKWADKDRFKFSIRDLHLKTAEEMRRGLLKISAYRKQYIYNTMEVAYKCYEFRIKQRKIKLPDAKIPRGYNESEYMEEICKAALKDKFGDNKKQYRKYYKRFREEFKLIKEKKFIKYFLIVKELIDWCKKNNIMVGPGRGSVGGSLIAYLMGITSVDPIRYGMLFSRFISKDRIDYPDIDIDFEHTKRPLVRKHLEEKYGEKRIAGVSSFNRMKSRAVIRDIGRVFEINAREVDEFAKVIDPTEEGGIQKAIEETEEGKEFYRKYKRYVDLAKQLEGQIRGYSKHAAALIVSKRRLDRDYRCNLVKRSDLLDINWEKNDAEYVGLMKLDILGIRLLSILSKTRELIKENHKTDIIFEDIDLEDEKVFNEMNQGNTVGVFQLGTWATTSLIKEVKIDKFLDIAAIISLVRPGPMNSGMADEYIKRKREMKWERKHPKYERILKDTYGVIAYQEQVMKIINQIAGLPYHVADEIRKIIGKKRDAKEFRPYKRKFIQGCLKKGYLSKQEAIEFWRGLEKHAKYSFNLSHAVEYAMLAYWCSWLKYYYPTEFICSSLTFTTDKSKKNELVEEAYRLNLELIMPKCFPPTDPIKWIAKDNKLYIPFIEVKGFGEVKSRKAMDIQIKSSFLETKKEIVKHNGKFGEILEKLKAYDNGMPIINEHIKSLFDFRLPFHTLETFPELKKRIGQIKEEDFKKLIDGDIKILSKSKRKLLRKVRWSDTDRMKFLKRVSKCKKCALRKQCEAPVRPSIGIYNAMIIGEAPGFKEDQEGIGFYEHARSGSLVWSSLARRGYRRRQFHVTNIVKCFPSITKTPTPEYVNACRRLLNEEFRRIKPIVTLAFGNTCRYFFTNIQEGITQISGKVEWNEDLKTFIVWCIHPASKLYNSSNNPLWEAGINSFVKTLKAIGMPKAKNML